MRSARERLLAMTDRHAGRLRSTLTEGVREATRDYADELERTVELACAAIRMAIARARESHAEADDLAQARLRDLATQQERCRALAAELSSLSDDV
jgi:hypothetical protein